MQTATPRHIINLVIGTLAGLTILYGLVLAYLAVFNIQVDEKVMSEFRQFGTVISSAFIGSLLNTRSAPADVVSTTKITEETQTDPASDPKTP